MLSFVKDGTHGTHPDASEGPLLLSAKNIKNGCINWDESDRRISQHEYEKIHSTFNLMSGDVLMTIVGSIGEVAILKTPENITFQRSVAFLRPNENITPEFLYSEIQTSRFQKDLDSRKSTSAQPGIYLGDLSEMPFSYPSDIHEQKQIGAFILKMEDAITLHQCKNYRRQTGAPYVKSNSFQLQNTATWEQRKFGEITDVRSASRVHREEWTDAGVPFYRSSDVMAALNGTENEKAFISEELYEKLSSVSGKLEKGDVLVTGGGSVGNPYIVPDNSPLYTKDADLLWIKHSERLDPYFVYEFFFSPVFRNYLGSVSHVGTIAHYTITQLSETPISIPSIEEQRKIGKLFENLDHAITLHQCKHYHSQTSDSYCKSEPFLLHNTATWEQRKLEDIFIER